MNKSGFFQISSNHITTLLLVALLIGSLAISTYFYTQMPDKMITHWNNQEIPDGKSSREVGLFIFPAILGLITTLFLLIPNIDPLKKNILKFEKQFGTFLILLSSFFIIIQAQIISWNLKVFISPNIIRTIAIGILFFYLGTLLKHAKRNFFIGIKTPWTLNSDFVWNKTHKLGSILFKILASLIVLSTTFYKQNFWIIIGSTIATVLILIIYSYHIHSKKQTKIKSNPKSQKKTKKA